MKRLLIIALLSTCSMADEVKDPCVVVGKLAESTMTARQMNVSMSKMMEINHTKIGRALVMEAYKQPALTIKKNQDKSIADFKNKALYSCYKEIEK